MTKKLAKIWSQYHWGLKPTGTINTRSRWHSDGLVEYGRLMELHIAPTDKPKPQQGDYIITIPESHLHTSYLFFESTKKKKPLVIELNIETQKECAKLYDDISHSRTLLKDLALIAGGYQAKRTYPKIQVKPIGVCVAVTYRTPKATDGLSNYIHQFGEPYKKGEKWTQKPILAVSSKGELFFAGGNYKCEIEGIIN